VLTVHRAERADALVVDLGEQLAAVPGDPFQPDVVAVPSKGVERWIAQSLSAWLGARSGEADGVCANVVFPSPSRLVREVLVAATGVSVDDDPWAEERLPWALLDVIDDCAGEDWCRTLGRHLGLVEGGVNRGRRMAVAQKFAGLFTAYAAERPTMLTDWRAGRDTDGYGGRIDDDLNWQAELWRRLRQRIDAESPAERLYPACQRLRSEPEVAELPERLSIFGPTRLTTAQLVVLDALAAHRDVHLWLPFPSDGLWRRLGEVVSTSSITVKGTGSTTARRDDPTAEVPAHSLLRSLGRDAREMHLRLHAHMVPGANEYLPVANSSGSLLEALQADLRADQAPEGAHAMADGDTTLQVHACHGRHRQVEVLREALLGLLDDDPTLELREIIVMCPDIDAYAPLISASLGIEVLDDTDDPDAASQVHPGHRLTFRLADRSLRHTNPVLDVVARLLELADSRLTASEVLDLAAMQPVRRRFRFDEEALERIGDWVRRAGVRWGLDANARAGYGLPGIGQNTWTHGLDRLLAGVTMDEDDLRLVGTAFPLDDVDSNEIELAGRVAELLDRLEATVDALRQEQSIEQWVQQLTEVVDLFTDVAPRDAWQVTQAKATLAGAAQPALVSTSSTGGATGSTGGPLGSIGSTGGPRVSIGSTSGPRVSTGSTSGLAGAPLALSDVRALLGDRLRGRPTRANFRTGHLTVCTMVPMRSVPHRVVCLLGLDDGVFPRSTSIDGDDILARQPRVGERDRRSEDRQLFLDAILAAKERLVLLYTGADERTGAERPPAVPLGELLDVLDQTATVPDGRVRDRVLLRHPLQPFDSRNFERGELIPTETFSFDRASYAGSLAMRAGQSPPQAFLDPPLPAVDDLDIVNLESLIRFLEHPVRTFLQDRLELRTADEEDEPSDAIPVCPSKLEEWAVGDRLLRAGLAGQPVDGAQRVERLRGELPPGQLGATVLQPIADKVAAVVEKSAPLRTGEPDAIDVSVGLPSGPRLEGTVPRVYGDRVVRIEYSQLSAKHRIRAWVQLLALCAGDPSRPWGAVTVGRKKVGKKEEVVGSFLTAVPRERAIELLDQLVRLYRLGLTCPLPVPPKTAAAYAEKRRRGCNPANSKEFAGQEWEKQGQNNSRYGEFDDGDHRRVRLQTMNDLIHQPVDPSEEYADEPHRFGQLARTIWTPMLAAEDIQ